MNFLSRFSSSRRSAIAVIALTTVTLSSGAIILTRVADAQTTDAPADAVWLDSLDISKMKVGYGAPQAKLSVDKNALTLGGRTFSRGVGTHALSQIAVDLDGRGKSFSATVGVDDETAKKGSVVFEIYLDGKLVAKSGVMRGGTAPQKLAVDLTGAKRLILRVDDNDDGIDFDHADWGDAFIEMMPGAMPIAVEAPLIVTSDVDTAPPMPIARASVAPPQPKIHGARATGATPGRPFLFQIPATGQAPLTYSAQNLPSGLTLDAKTGVLSGTLQSAGTSRVKLRVQGPRGTDTRNLTIVGGQYKLVQTPPMGWNSWNIYHCDVDESKVRQATDELIGSGLNRHGYQYVNIDDCWQGERDAQGEVQTNAKFGDMKALGEYIHARGLKYGIYSSPGPKTCAGKEGSYRHELQDAQTYAKWGVDFLKHDWCSYGGVAVGEGVEKQKIPYRTMRTALDKVNRDIVYSLCQYGMGDVWKWGNDPDIKADLWRTTGDIGPSYGSMANIGFRQDGLQDYAGPGHWNDPDMLFMHALKPNEQITHLTLWSMLAAPLLIGSDISKLSPYSIDALSNDEVIEIDQDAWGQQGKRILQDGNIEVWARPLWDGTMAVALFNRSRKSADVAVKWSDLGLKGAQSVRDLWQQKETGMGREGLIRNVPPHGAMLFKVGAPKARDYTPGK